MVRLALSPSVASAFAADFKITLPVLVDGIDDKVGLAYAARPDRRK